MASKHGLAGFTQSLLREVKDRGVRVTLIHRGRIDTEFDDGHLGHSDGHTSLGPAQLAALILQVIDQPAGLVVDELVVHSLGQSDF